MKKGIIINVKKLLIAIIISTMLVPFIAPVAKAINENEGTDNNYIKFDANWANGTKTIEVGTENTVYMNFTLTLSGVPTGFKNAKIFLKDNSTDKPTIVHSFGSVQNATGTNYLEFNKTLNSGVDLSGTVSLKFNKTEDYSEYVKNLVLSLTAEYTDPNDKTQKTVNLERELIANVTPTPTRVLYNGATYLSGITEVNKSNIYEGGRYVGYRANSVTDTYDVTLLSSKYTQNLEMELNFNRTSGIENPLSTGYTVYFGELETDLGTPTKVENSDGSVSYIFKKGIDSDSFKDVDTFMISDKKYKISIRYTINDAENELKTKDKLTINTKYTGWEVVTDKDGVTASKINKKTAVSKVVSAGLYLYAPGAHSWISLSYNTTENEKNLSQTKLENLLNEGTMDLRYSGYIKYTYGSQNSNVDGLIKHGGLTIQYFGDDAKIKYLNLTGQNFNLKSIENAGNNNSTIELQNNSGEKIADIAKGDTYTTGSTAVSELQIKLSDFLYNTYGTYYLTYTISAQKLKDLGMSDNEIKNIMYIENTQSVSGTWIYGGDSARYYATDSEADKVSYLEVSGNEDANYSELNIPQNKTLKLSMYKNTEKIKNTDLSVKNVNPKIFVKLSDDFNYNIKSIEVKNGTGKIYIPTEELANGEKGYYITKIDDVKFLVINLVGTYNSDNMGKVDIEINWNRTLIKSITESAQKTDVYMITDNQNYFGKTNNSYNLEKDGVKPDSLFYTYNNYTITQNKYLDIQSGIIIGKDMYYPSAEKENMELTKNNPYKYVAGSNIKYSTAIKNQAQKQIENIKIVSRIPLAENKSITGTQYNLLEESYVLPDSYNLPNGYTKGEIVPQISLTNLSNIKLYVKAGTKGAKTEVDSSNYTLYYSEDKDAGMDSIYEPLTESTDVSKIATIKVELNENYKLNNASTLFLEYEMEMPDEKGMVGQISAITYNEVGSSETKLLEPLPAYVLQGDPSGQITINKSFKGYGIGVAPDGISLSGIEFKLVNVDTGDVLITPETDSNGIVKTDANCSFTLTKVPNGTYELIELSELVGYDKVQYTTIEINNGDIVNVDVVEEPKKGDLIVSKTWEDTNDQQAAVSFRIERITTDLLDFTPITITTDKTTGLGTAYGLPYGRYKITETSGKYGWYADAVETTVSQKETTQVIENKIGKGQLKITKTVPTGDSVVGLKFEITGNGYVSYTNKEGQSVKTDLNKTITVGSDYSSDPDIDVQIENEGRNATITLNNVPLGIYNVKEIEMPKVGEGEDQTDRYVAINRINSLDVNGATVIFALSNNWKTGDLKIVKTSAEGIDLTQFKVRVSCEETVYGSSYDKTFDFPEDGILNIYGLHLGTYKVEEIESDYYNAYYFATVSGEKTITPQTYKVSYNETTTAKIYNETTTGYVKILKTLEGKDASKAVGIKFKVTGYSPTGSWVEEEIELTGTEEINGKKYATGVSNAIMAGGEYVITEINTPEFYEEPEEISVDITKHNNLSNPAVVDIENKRAKGNLDISTETIPAGGPLYPIIYRVVEVELEGQDYTEVQGTEQTIEADATGRVLLNAINAGNYLVEQTTIPASYIKDLAQIVEVPGNDTGYAIFEIEKKEELQNTTIIIKKEVLNKNGDIASAEELSSAGLNKDESFEIKLTNIDTDEVYYSFVKNGGQGVIKGLTEGTYKIEENYKPKYETIGYSKKVENVYAPIEETNGKFLISIGSEEQAENEIEIRVQNKIDDEFGFGGQISNDNLARVYAEEEIIIKGTRSIVYIVDEQGAAIPGATFRLLDSSGKQVSLGTNGNVFVSNNKKLVIKGLPAGIYSLECVSVPGGYLIPETEQIIVYEHAVRVVRVEIQKNIPRGSMIISTVYEDEKGNERYAPRSKYMIMNTETEEILTFKKNADGTYKTSNVETATDTIQVRAGEMRVNGIPVGATYQVAIVDLTEKYGVVKEIPEEVTVIEGTEHSVKVNVEERAGFVKSSNIFYNNMVAIDSNGEIWQYNKGNDYSELYKVSRKNSAGVKFIDAYDDINGLMLALDSNGKIWNGDICVSDMEESPLNNVKIKKIDRISSTGYGINYLGSSLTLGALAIDENGKVWHSSGGDFYNAQCLSIDSPIENLEIVHIDIGIWSILMIDKNGNLWGVGDNETGKMGIDLSIKSKTEITALNVGNNLDGIKIKKVSSGRNATIFIDENNKIWICGTNDYGNLGIGSSDNKHIEWNPICLTDLEDNPLYGIKAVEVSWEEDTVAIIDIDGRLWTWGYNRSGRLGGENENYGNSNIPVCISELESNDLDSVKLISVSLGDYNGSAIDENGNLWVWGYYLPLGYYNGSSGSPLTPTKITLPVNSYFSLRNKFTKIASGYKSAAGIDEKGMLWIWGNSDHNLYGNGTSYTNNSQNYSIQPTCISKNYRFNKLLQSKIIDIALAYDSIIVLDEKGKVWTWGPGWSSDIGYSEDSYESMIPRCVSDMEESPLYGKTIKSVEAGSSNFAAIDSEGKLYITGNNTFTCVNDQYPELSNVEFTKAKFRINSNTIIALDSENRVWKDSVCISTIENSPIQNIKILDCDINFSSNIILLDENGKVWLNNNNDFICISDIETTPLYNKTITRVYCGYDYYLVIDSNNKIWTWGNNTYNGIIGTSEEIICMSDLTNIKAKDISISSYGQAAFITDMNDDIFGFGVGRDGIFGGSRNSKYVTYNYPSKLYGITSYNSIYGDLKFNSVNKSGIVEASNGKTYSVSSSNLYGITEYIAAPKEEEVEEVDEVFNIKEIKEYSEVYNNKYTIIIDNDGKVWSKGSNTYRQLGDETGNSSIKYKCISDLYNSPLKDIIMDKVLFLNDRMVFVKDNEDNMWYWGQKSATPIKVQDFKTSDYKTITWSDGIDNYNLLRVFYAITDSGDAWYFNGSKMICLNTEYPILNTVDFSQMKRAKGGNYYNYMGIDTNGNIWAWGENAYALGLGTGSISTPTKVTSLTNASEILYFSEKKAFVKDKTGNIYVTGSNGYTNTYSTYGSLGIGSTSSVIYNFTKVLVPTNSKIYQFGDNCIAIDSSKRIWTWGLNGSGQCGDGTTSNRNTPVCLNTKYSDLSSVQFESVNISNNVVTATDTTGKKWIWGSNSYKKIEFSSKNNITVPQEYKDKLADQLFEVEEYLTDEWANTVIIKGTDGNYYGWGYNFYGQLSFVAASYADLSIINITQKCADIGCILSEILSVGNGLIIVKDITGNLWGWGTDSYGVLGKSQLGYHSPIKITNGIDINTAIYKYISYRSIIILQPDGNLYLSGIDTYGGYSYVCVNNIKATGLYGKKIKQVGFTGTDVIAITDDGSLYIISTSNCVRLSGMSYETIGSWDTGFELLKDVKYNN